MSSVFYDKIGQNINLIPIYIVVAGLLMIGGVLAISSPNVSAIVWNDNAMLYGSFKKWIKSAFGILPPEITKVKDIHFNKLLFLFGIICSYYAFFFILVTGEEKFDLILLFIEFTGLVSVIFFDSPELEKVNYTQAGKLVSGAEGDECR